MLKKITSRENQNIKDAIRLLNSVKYRKKSKSFTIEGMRLCEEILKNKIKIKKLFLTEKFLEKKQVLSENLKNNAEESYLIPENILKLISHCEAPQGVICICEVDKIFRTYKIEDNVKKIIILENIQNPSNLGAILRSCDAFGIKTVVVSKDCCDIFSPKVLSGAMGSVFRINISYEESIPNFIKALNKNGFKTFATVPSGNAQSILKADFSGKVAVVIGNEGNGITKETINECSEKFTIPMKGNTESLNAAVAAGIIIFQLTINN